MPVPEQAFPASTPSRVRVVSSTLVKPIYDAGAGDPPPATDLRVRLSQFDKITYDTHIAVIYGFSPPVSVSTADIAVGLGRALAYYRDWAGRLAFDVVEDEPFVLLNDGGARFVEAYSDAAFDRAALTKPSPALLALHPQIHPVGPELVQVQLTRFACGTLTVGFTAHHLVADGHAASNFLVAWGRATRGLPIGHPQVIYNRAALFTPRRPARIEFEHRGAEFAARKMFGAAKEDPRKDCVVVHRTHFGKQFLAGLKAKASATASGGEPAGRPFTTFECLVAHLWRVITRARGLDPRTTTEVRISVDGRSRLRPRVPDEYFGNLVLWALPRSPAGDVSHRSLGHAATTVSDAIARVADDRYFRSFIDFASSPAVRAEGLETTADAVECVMSPHLEVHSWLRFPFHDVDFGAGHPFCFMPTYSPAEGMIVLLPSVAGDSAAGIEVYVALFDYNLPAFIQLCYQLD